MKQIKQLQDLIARFGRPDGFSNIRTSAFNYDERTKSYYPESRAAYKIRLPHFQILTAIERGSACMDPIEEMKGCLGVVRRRLWLYMLSCFPQDLGVIMEIGKLEEKSKGRHIVCGIEEIIISRLNRGRISDCDFAARILDEARFMEFAKKWFTRDERVSSIRFLRELREFPFVLRPKSKHKKYWPTAN